MTDAQKLVKIRDMCNHPGSFHWTGFQMAAAIIKIINDNQPIDYTLSDIDEPLHYELAHDAVFIDEEIN